MTTKVIWSIIYRPLKLTWETYVQDLDASGTKIRIRQKKLNTIIKA